MGAASKSICISCAPGTWSSELGAASQSSCMKCPAGTWSSRRGAIAQSTCTECKAGTYQPALGQASDKNCMRCGPGKFGASAGASACKACEAGSWNGAFEATSCTACPAGTWTPSTGTVRSSDCHPRSSSEVTDAHVTIALAGLAFGAACPSAQVSLRAGLARSIASACGVAADAVVDLYGARGSVTVAQGAVVSAFVLGSAGLSTSELQARLSSEAVRREMAELIVKTLQEDSGAVVGSPQAGAVSVRLERFTPQASTTVTTSTTGTSTTVAAGTPAPAGAADLAEAAGKDGEDGGSSSTTSGGVPPWVWCILGGAVTGIAVLVAWIVAQRRSPSAEAATGKETAPPAAGGRNELPMLLGGGDAGAGREGVPAKGSEEAGDLEQQRGQRKQLRTPSVLRTTIDNVEEGGLWDDERPVDPDRMGAEIDCTKGCDVKCW